MPLPATLLSLLGLAPYVICGLGALGPDPGRAAEMLLALIAYASVVLGFIGGIHWGLVLRETEPPPPLQYIRIVLAVAPMLLGWAAVMLASLAIAWPALLLLIIAYVGAMVLEHQGGRRGVMPHRYLWLRWGFTVVAVAMLVTVTTLRLLGQTIAF